MKKKQIQRSIEITDITGRSTPISGILSRPTDAQAILVLAHGAGAGMNHSFMNELSESLCDQGVATLRFQFPYMEDGAKRPDSPKLATATIAAAVQWALKEVPDLPVFAGGKSFGGRMTTTAAALSMIPSVKGLVCFGFPLHVVKKPSIDRAKHLHDVKIPMLFLQGTRDALADLTLMTQVTQNLSQAKMHIVDGADHSFAVLKRSERCGGDVIEELAVQTREFCETFGK